MASPKAINFIFLAILVAIMLLIMSSEMVAAMLNVENPEVYLGRRVLGAEYNTTGRGGYN